MNNIYIKSIFVITIITVWLFSGSYFSFTISRADAAIGDIGHWRDSIGSQIPGTTFAAFNFDQELVNENIYTRPNNSTIQLDEAGDYLIISSIRYTDNSNGRFNPQARVALTLGTGTLFTSYYTGYSRRTSDNESWTRAVGVVIGASAGAQIQIQQRRDTDAPSGGSVTGESDVQVVRINPTNYGIYAIGGTTGALGGITPNLVDVTAITSESNAAAIEGNTTTDTITVKGDNKRYLVAWSVSGDTGGSRTQRIGHLEYDGVDDLTTRSYCYQRNSSNEYCGLGSMDLIETATADIAIQTEVFRGPGVLADQGGADVDGGFDVDGNGQMVVLELPDSLEAFKSHDSIGLQDITAALTFNGIRDVDFNDAASFTKATNTTMDVTNPADIFSWANVWTARNNVAANARQTSYGSITVNGVAQSIGEHGNYSRGNQSTTDTFAMSFHPAGIFTTASAGDLIGIDSDPLPGGQNGGTDRTQANTFGFFSLNLDTLLPPAFNQSAYRFFDNTDTTDVGATLAALDTAATLANSGDAFRLRTLTHISDAQLRLNEESFKLQFAEKSGTCDTSFVGETYTDVTAATLIAYNNNTTPVDGANLTANINDPTHGGDIIVNQDYEELNNFTNTVAAIPKGQDAKWDFSLIDNLAPADTSYCLRTVKSDGNLLDTYTVIPEIITAPPFCATSLSSYPYTQGFEGSIGDWTQSTADDNDWLVNTGGTPSVNTGPTAAIEGTDYIYVEASGNGTGYPNMRSIITSPCFDLNGKQSATFNFQYHMYSTTTGTMGSIDLEISTGGAWTSLFNRTTNQGNQWNAESIDLSAYVGQEIRLRFNRLVGNTWQADVAVDDVSLTVPPQSLTFSISDNTIGFDTLSSIASRYATGDTLGSGTAVTAHSISASTNAINGYVISVDGTTLTCVSCTGSPTITEIGASATAPNSGTEQFGLRASVNSGTGLVSVPYGTANYALDTAAFPDAVLTGSGDDVTTIFDFEYLANIASNTDGGEYESILTYTITTTF